MGVYLDKMQRQGVGNELLFNINSAIGGKLNEINPGATTVSTFCVTFYLFYWSFNKSDVETFSSSNKD